MTRSRLLIAALASVSAVALAGGAGATARGSAEPLSAAPAAKVAAVAAAEPCKDGQPPVASLAPGDITTDPNSMTDSPTWDNIRTSRKLTVGTSGDVLLWGARNPTNGRLEGYDIDLLNEIAKRLGVEVVDYKVINYGQRLTKLADKSVDLVAHTMTINCARWQGSDGQPNAINFSTEYYPAGQKVLVRSDSGAKSIKEVKGKICVPAASTNVAHAQDAGVAAANLVQPPVIGDCLVKFQEGEVVAVTGDDTVLAGFSAQDPYAKVIGDAFSSEPYGLGISAEDPQFTRFVNAVLEDLRSDGTLRRLYNKWMADAVTGGVPAIPPAVYGREIPALGRT